MSETTSLVLSRRVGEFVNIGGNGDFPLIRVEVTRIREDQVQLRIQSPRSMLINRDEITRAITERERRCNVSYEAPRGKDIDALYFDRRRVAAEFWSPNGWNIDQGYQMIETIRETERSSVRWSSDGTEYKERQEYNDEPIPVGSHRWYMMRPTNEEEMFLATAKRRDVWPYDFSEGPTPVPKGRLYDLFNELFREGGGYILRPSEIDEAE